MTEVKVSHEDLDNALIEPEEEPPAEETEPIEDVATEGDQEGETEEVDDDTESEEEVEESTEEEPEDEEEPEEPEDNRERSKLGRRVSSMEAGFQTLQSIVQTMADTQKSFIEQFPSMMSRTDNDDTEIEDDIDEYISKKDLPIFLNKWESDKAKMAEKYNADYNAYFRSQGQSVDNELHKLIMDEMLANHNFKRSNDGNRDAELNYLNAKIAVLEKSALEARKPKNPLEKNKGKKVDNLGGPSETVTTSKSEPVIKLDKHAADFVKRTNMSEESVKKALSRETPEGLKERAAK